jgi:hypothetical protein
MYNRRSYSYNSIGLRPALLNVRKCILTGNIVYAEKRSYAPSLPFGKENIYRNGRPVHGSRPPLVSLLGRYG